MIFLLSSKTWNVKLAKDLENLLKIKVYLISDNSEFMEKLKNNKPKWIFVLHWNHIIPKEIWKEFKTVIFHMTDLPYGRGGSPLQNLIKLKHENTILSAIECTEIIDGGDIYLKKPLNLNGSAEEVFLRSNELMGKMIYEIIKNEPKVKPQKGEIINFRRREPIESDLSNCKNGNIQEWYDQIRMLDAEGYPFAYIEINGLKLEFRRVNKRSNGLIADVYISEIDG